MPTISLMNLPKTKSSEEFEEMCLDYLNEIYRDEFSFMLYGRNGQCQNGIDIVSKNAKNGSYIVAQCKDYVEDLSQRERKKFRAIVQEEISKTEKLPFCIDRFFIMTAYDSDKALQNDILQLNSEYDFEIYIVFWKDIEQFILNNNIYLKKYYPSFCQEKASEMDRIIDRFTSIM